VKILKMESPAMYVRPAKQLCRSVFNVIEIDAASNNGVDNIRQIKDEVQYSPTEGKYKVYIIDEVHMLSIGAFNALLKTLEELLHMLFLFGNNRSP
jgi:DNA polymerase III gamma/tau subunit